MAALFQKASTMTTCPLLRLLFVGLAHQRPPAGVRQVEALCVLFDVSPRYPDKIPEPIRAEIETLNRTFEKKEGLAPYILAPEALCHDLHGVDCRGLVAHPELLVLLFDVILRFRVCIHQLYPEWAFMQKAMRRRKDRSTATMMNRDILLADRIKAAGVTMEEGYAVFRCINTLLRMGILTMGKQDRLVHQGPMGGFLSITEGIPDRILRRLIDYTSASEQSHEGEIPVQS